MNQTPSIGIPLLDENTNKTTKEWAMELNGQGPNSMANIVDREIKGLKEKKADLVNGKVPKSQLPDIPSGGGGTTDHSGLENRNLPNQHTIGAITGLREELDGKQPAGSYLTQETDPTVPAWAKQPNKPAYTAKEVGALPDSTEALKNPNALTFIGAVSATYDGSKPVSVEIPVGGGSSFVRDIPCEKGVADITGNPDMGPTGSSEWQRFVSLDGYHASIRLKVMDKELNTETQDEILLFAKVEAVVGDNINVTRRYFDPAQNKEYRWHYIMSIDTGALVGEATAEIISVEEQIGGKQSKGDYFVRPDNSGAAGQFAVNDGAGGIMWKTIYNGEEVAY